MLPATFPAASSLPSGLWVECEYEHILVGYIS